ncbi:MAG: ABC transporter ATP-binding protein [Planctomycetes bacterium]|nr:ABC transporter ATP-binding protein [Planctomycetota bacterium]
MGPNVILEDLDAVEERRIRRRRSKQPLPPELVGTTEDPAIWKRLFSYGRPYMPHLALAFVLSMVAAGAKLSYLFVIKQLLGPFFESKLQDELMPTMIRVLQRALAVDTTRFAGDLRATLTMLGGLLQALVRTAEPVSQLQLSALLMVALICFEQGNKYSQKLLMRTVSLKVVSFMRVALFDRILTLSMRFFHVNHSGKLLSRLTNDLNRLGQLLVDVMVSVLSDVFTVVGAIYYVWYEGGIEVILALVLAGVTFIPVQQLGRRIRSKEQGNQKKMSDVFLAISEVLSSQKIVKAFGAESHERERFVEADRRFTEGRMKSTALRARTEPLVEVLGAVGVAAFMYVGGMSVIDGSKDGGEFFTIILALFYCVGALRRLSDTSTNLQSGLSSADRVATVLYSEPELVDKADALELDGFHEAIEFDHVDYAHDPEQPVLRDVSFRLPKGGTLAIVGHTGAGKSTIGDLVARFYDVDRGAVRIDGHDVRDVTMSSLRHQIAMVTQETVLFQGTIGSNIAYAMPDPRQADVERVAKAAFAHDFIMALPNGYDTPVGERGTTLSGGERQRVAIARALLRDAPILILDEATSALDTKSEKIVQDAIDNLKAGRTTILIAHRLSTIRDADLILVLDGGAVVERGTHAELLAHGGLYAQMVGLQSTDG